MKANELRIGNLLYHNLPTKKPVTVKVINCDDTLRIDFGNGDILGCFGIKEFKPIQLNEEWLLKFGFEKEYGAFKLKGLKCWLTKYTSEPNLYSVNVGNIKLSTLKYVHELQNLYFALTGSELTVA